MVNPGNFFVEDENRGYADVGNGLNGLEELRVRTTDYGTIPVRNTDYGLRTIGSSTGTVFQCIQKYQKYRNTEYSYSVYRSTPVHYELLGNLLGFYE
jgi:hypothetical protein